MRPYVVYNIDKLFNQYIAILVSCTQNSDLLEKIARKKQIYRIAGEKGMRYIGSCAPFFSSAYDNNRHNTMKYNRRSGRQCL